MVKKKEVYMRAFNIPACIVGGGLIPSVFFGLGFGTAYVVFFAAAWIVLLLIDYQIGYGFLWIRKDLLLVKRGLKINIFTRVKQKSKLIKMQKTPPLF